MAGRYSGFLESFDTVREIVNMDTTLPAISTRRTDPRHTDVLGSVTEMPFEDESFDWLLCSNVIPLVEDDRAATRELARVLKPGSFALISMRTPTAQHVSRASVRGYTLETARQLLAHGELEIAWHGYCSHLAMKWLAIVWQWQYVHLGRGRRSVMPRLMVLAFGHADRLFPVGPPRNLVVLARRHQPSRVQPRAPSPTQ